MTAPPLPLDNGLSRRRTAWEQTVVNASADAAELVTASQERHRRPVALGFTWPMATNAIPAAITAIHSKRFMTAPPFAPERQDP
jgi:hypothetical protein